MAGRIISIESIAKMDFFRAMVAIEEKAEDWCKNYISEARHGDPFSDTDNRICYEGIVSPYKENIDASYNESVNEVFEYFGANINKFDPERDYFLMRMMIAINSHKKEAATQVCVFDQRERKYA